MKQRKRARLKDVAEKAGTSIATASRALTNSGYVSDKTMSIVLEAAAALGYQPDLRARSLRKQDSHSIGLVIPNLLNTYYTSLADVTSRLILEYDYQLIMASTRDDSGLEKKIIYDLIRSKVAGLIWVPANPIDELIEYILDHCVPSVSIVRRLKGDPVDSVVFEDFTGSKAAVEHLIQLGHRRIGLICGDVSHSSNHERWQGYLAAIDDAGLSVDESLLKIGPTNVAWGITAANELVRNSSFPTAIFVASNVFMPGVVKTLHQIGLNCPDDISLICFDDVDWFSFSNPTITAVNIASDRLAETAVDLLFRRIQDEDSGERPASFIEIGFDLIVRDSTAPPRT